MPKRKKYVPNAWESMGKTYYVARNNPRASDDNPGTKSLPFKTISKAAAVADMYDKVVIDKGIYREQVPLLRHGHRYQPRSLIVFKAAPGRKVYLKGSDVFTAEWQEIGEGLHKAKLPAHLFEDGAYNPYELSCVVDEPGKVRPTEGPILPETLGQIYVDEGPLEQVNSVRAVQDTPGSFLVSADGGEIICHFADGEIPKDKLVELTVRERCFKPEFSGQVMIQTMGMVVEHAADPGPFSTCRPLTIRRNPGAGITVRKTFHAPDRTSEVMVMRGNIAYLSKDKPTLVSSVIDGTVRCPPQDAPVMTMLSDDSGKTWRKSRAKSLIPGYYFLDEANGMLFRHYSKVLEAPDGAYGSKKYEHLSQVSRDAGRTWTDPERLDLGSQAYDFRMLKLQDRRILGVCYALPQRPGASYVAKTWLGRWRRDLSGLDWEPGQVLEAGPEQSNQGLTEPHACQFPDGRLFCIFRQCPRPASQDEPGITSVKLFSVSDDSGRTWTKPRPLTYEDGRYVYSSTSFPDVICSSKNGRAYVIININDRPSTACDPRTTLQIAEIDTKSVCVKRDTIAVIETMHEEHHWFVRFSNWCMLEDRYTKNLLLFMKLQMCEYCPVLHGYDLNSYRYEIGLPE